MNKPKKTFSHAAKRSLTLKSINPEKYSSESFFLVSKKGKLKLCEIKIPAFFTLSVNNRRYKLCYKYISRGAVPSVLIPAQ